MSKRIIEYHGKKYALVSDTEENECDRCALREACHEDSDLICKQFFTDDEVTDHRLVEVTDDMLTEQKMSDEAQEPVIKTAVDRANDIAYCLVILLAATLIGGHTYDIFFVACAGALLYMLLSALQALWQGATIWWFKNHHSDEVPTDYPEWIGGTAWVFYYLKMAVITASVVYIAYSFLRLL